MTPTDLRPHAAILGEALDTHARAIGAALNQHGAALAEETIAKLVAHVDAREALRANVGGPVLPELEPEFDPDGSDEDRAGDD